MNIERPCAQELWDSTPTAIKDDISFLKACAATLGVAVQRLGAIIQHAIERPQQDSCSSSRLPSSDPPQALGTQPWPEPGSSRPCRQHPDEGHTRAAERGIMYGCPAR